MKRTQLFHIAFSLLFCIALFSCGSKKYIKEIPYNYSSDEFSQTAGRYKEQSDSKYSIINDNTEKLSDEELRIKEKYSIIMEVMPKEIRDYKLYSYIDEWIGTPYKKQMLEKQTGVEMSYFVQALFSDVYEETFSKTPDEIFRSKAIQLFTGRTFLKEGDIVFFRYDKFHPISVGVIRLERTTSRSQTACATNCATPRYVKFIRFREKNKVFIRLMIKSS